MAKESISWSAYTDKSWVTLTPSNGFGDSNVKVTVEPAKTESDDLTATISINYSNGDSYTKTISRCERKAVSRSYSLSFTVSGTCDSCFEGDAQLKGIKGTTITTLDNGTQTSATTELSIDDIKVSYVINGVSYPSIQKNMTTIPRTVKVVGVWNGAVYEATIMQSAMSVTSSGYAETSTSYTNLYFPSSNPSLASSCSAGTATFSLRADKVVRNSTITAQTSCGDKITIDGSSQESVTRDTDVSQIADFSLCSASQSSLGSFNGNVLSYNSNETDGNVALRICGKIGSNTVSTTYTIPKGSCGKVYYVHIFFDKDSVPYKGSASEMTAQLTYFASLSDDPTDISTAITDGVKLLTESGDRFTIGEPVVEDYVIHRNVLFNTYMEEMGTNYTFTAEYEGVTASTSIYQSSQYENVIPAADYFVFTYEWTSDDGTDLDSATLITSPIIQGLSYKAVGYSYNGGFSTLGTYSKPYLKHGGDNRRSGAEGAIICFKNIVNSFNIGMEDTIKCEIYANWYLEKINGNMSVNCVAYKGSPNGTFSDEISQEGYVFKPIEGKCVQVWPSNGSEKFDLSVKASGAYYNPYTPETCIDKIYSHVATLIHHVGTQQTSLILRQGEDNGYVSRYARIGFWCDGKNLSSAYIYSTGTTIYDYKNVSLRYVNEEYNENQLIQFLKNSSSKIKLTFYRYNPNSILQTITISPNVTYISSDFEYDWVDRLVITTHDDGTFDLYLKIKANDSGFERSIDLGIVPVLNFLPRCPNRQYDRFTNGLVFRQEA